MKSALSIQLKNLSFRFIILLIMMFFSSCRKDTVPEKIPCPTSISWVGQTYQTIEIGNQCWFRENINIGKFVFGTKDQTNNDTIEKYCWYDEIPSCDGYGVYINGMK